MMDDIMNQQLMNDSQYGLSNLVIVMGQTIPVLLILLAIIGIMSAVGHYLLYHFRDEEETIVMTEKKPEPHKQTYLEFVREQLLIERMMR